jgi:hypothetical protein
VVCLGADYTGDGSYCLNFQGFRLCFTRREANKSAYACAREDLSIVPLDVSFELITDFLVEHVQSDILSSFE